MLRLGCFALLLGIVVGLELQAQLNSQWQKFKSAHGKQYSGKEEEKRKMIFKSHVEDILKHNLEHDMGDTGFTLGVNEFSDMSHEEFVKNMCGVKSRKSHTRTRSNEVFKPSERANLPAAVDWRNQNIVAPVKNQGTTCGSCWAFSATAAIESAWAQAHNNSLTVLSDQQLLDCSDGDPYDNDGCGGGWPYEAMQYVVDNKGQDEQDCYEYDGVQNSQCLYNVSCMAASISNFVQLPEGNELALQEAVANIGPVSVCMDASQPGFQSYKSGIYYPSYCSQVTDHAIVVIGYGTENGQAYWLLKNSWGTSWGEEGFFKLARNANNLCAIASDAVYPTI